MGRPGSSPEGECQVRGRDGIVACALIVAGLATSSSRCAATQFAGYSLDLSVRYHEALRAEEFSKERAEALLMGATGLIAKKNDHSSCDADWTACINLVATPVSTFA